MLKCDRSRDTQPQTGASVHRLGRIERFHDAHPIFRSYTRPTITDREYCPRRAQSHIQFHPALPFPLHEFVKSVLKQVEKYLANLALAATDDGSRDSRRNDQTDIVYPE